MEFIEMSGRILLKVVNQDELKPADLAQVGVSHDSIVRVNRQGDLELRRARGWEVVGGLLGNFEERVRKHTGFDWVDPSCTD